MRCFFTFFGLFSSALIFSTLVSGENKTTTSPGGDIVLAEIDGNKLTLADFERKHPTGLFQAYVTFYDTERKTVEEFIDESLLERQAQKENLTVPQLLERHVNSTLPKDPSEESLRVFYEGVDTKEPFEAVRDQILQSVRERRLAKAKTAYMQSLHAQAKVVFRLAPPRAKVDLANTPLRGLPNAPVVLVEYADYECPYCQQMEPVLDRIEAEYKGKVALAYKDVPLPMHPRAPKAAEAAHCAGAQGKYWEYHDRLYSSKQLEVPQLKEHARALNLDTAAFDKCLDSGQQAGVVKTQMAEGQALKLQGTPSFFINGRFINGGPSYEALRQIVEEQLSISSQRSKDTAGILTR